MKHSTTFVLGVLFAAILPASPVLAGTVIPPLRPYPEQVLAVHEAEHAVDHAWELYHRAALGGTVASPAVQADIEEHLHDARTLITKAHEAAERGEERQVARLVAEITIHTSQAIRGSKEQKK